MSSPTDRVAVILGARNLGGAVADHLTERAWRVAAVARSEESVQGHGELGITADASDPDSLAGALARVRDELGPPALMVNAVSASRPPDDGAGFGGGPIADATLAGFDGWAAAVAEQSFVFLNTGVTLIQVTGGSSRRAMPGRGLWSAGAQATRAMVHAAAQELREEEIHVALLIVDATIESPKTADFARDQPKVALADQGLIAEAVEYLANQQPRAYTHELMLTPA